MKKIILYVFSMMICAGVFAQENQKKDTIPVQRTAKHPPDSSFKNPIYQGPAEIDSINRSDSLKGGSRVVPLERYKEDSIPKSPRKEK